MNPTIRRYHVLTLSGEEQATLRYCLYNLAQQKFVMYLDFAHKRKHFSITKVGHNLTEIFKQYDTYTSILAPFQGYAPFVGKRKMILYPEGFFRYVVEAVEKFNSETAELVVGADTTYMLSKHISALHDLVQKSKQYTYTLEEINNVKVTD